MADAEQTGVLVGTIRARDALCGSLTAKAALGARMQAREILAGEIAAEAALSGTIAAAQGDAAPIYDGDYTAEPKLFEDVTLHTKDQKMKSDVTVKKIPQYEVSNEAGGTTLIFGGE